MVLSPTTTITRDYHHNLSGPPQKKQRTFSPTSLTEFPHHDFSLGSTLSKADEQTIAPPMDCMSDDDCDENADAIKLSFSCGISVTDLSTEVLFAEYLSSSNNEDTVQKGLGLLWGRLGGGEFASSVTMAMRQRREEILNLGGHWVLTNLMRQYEADASIQIFCCSILRELLLGGGAARYQVYCAGGLDGTIEGMNRFPEHLHMQLSGCQFLSRLLLPPVSTTILEDMVRSTMGLQNILRLLNYSDDESCDSMAPSKKELGAAAMSLVCALLAQCPIGLRAELMETIKHHRFDNDISRRPNMSLEDYDSCSVRDEQYLL